MCQSMIFQPVVAVLVLLAPLQSFAGFLDSVGSINPQQVEESVKGLVPPQTAHAITEQNPKTIVSEAIADGSSKHLADDLQKAPDTALTLTEKNPKTIVSDAIADKHSKNLADEFQNAPALVPQQKALDLTEKDPKTLIPDVIADGNSKHVADEYRNAPDVVLQQAELAVTDKSANSIVPDVIAGGSSKMLTDEVQNAPHLVPQQTALALTDRSPKIIVSETVEDAIKIKLPKTEPVQQVLDRSRPPSKIKTTGLRMKWFAGAIPEVDQAMKLGNVQGAVRHHMSSATEVDQSSRKSISTVETVDLYEFVASNWQWSVLASVVVGCIVLAGWQLVARIGRRDQRSPTLLLDADPSKWTGSQKPEVFNRWSGEEFPLL